MSLFSYLDQPLEQKGTFFGKKRKVIVIAGPTGVGKTEFSLRLAKALGGEIISADAMQVYRGMDIGTAKISKEKKENIPHHLIDICDVKEPFNVVSFYHDAHKACREIFLRNHTPIVVGGSGFYLHAFLYGPPLGPPSDKEIRDYLESQMEKMGPEVLYERLQMLDPLYAGTITENDKNKIIRALEIIVIMKKPVSELRVSEKMLDVFDFRCWFLFREREPLYRRVEQRCEEMVDGGFIEEVKKLEKEGLRENRSAAQAIGYKQCLDFLNTKQSEEEKEIFLQEFKKVSRKYVKRQFTWFRKEPFFRWVDLGKNSFEKACEYVLQDFEQT